MKLTLGAPALLSMAIAMSAYGLSEQAYNWDNVRIGGGGFVPGIVFNQSEPNLIYARTDIGGAYRWNETDQSWEPLLDWVGWDNWGWNGVLSIATDPVDTDRVYAALGMYTNFWDPNNGAIARSSDRGQTWETTELPFKMGGNMPGRGMGERLRIDPNDNSILYFGAELGEGLWRSTDYGVTWNPVTNFPNPGNYAQDPNDTNSYLTSIQGVVWVAFDKSSGTPGSKSQRIFAGVADLEHSLYQSLDGGATWEEIPGAPGGYIPKKAVVDHVNGYLYVATSNTGGPYDGSAGEVWKYNISSGEWSDITPMTLASGDLYFGYSGLTIDRQDPKTLMVASLNSWWPDMIMFRTKDGGETWTRIWDWAMYPERDKRYELDISETPWLHFGNYAQPPEEPTKLGWMNESIEIDPFNSDRFMYGTGATIYGAVNLTNWDTGGTVNIKPMIKGLEETAVQDLASPPSGAHLFSALGDLGGFKHEDLTKAPDLMYQSPKFGTTTSIDFAELDPSIMVRVGHPVGDIPNNFKYIGVSTSSGDAWWEGANIGSPQTGGTVAMAADGSAIVWSPGGGRVHVSTTYGSTWTASEGVPANAKVESDRVNPSRFYAYSEGTFYYSVDRGTSFTASDAAGLPSNGHLQFKAVPGYEGHIWLAGGEITTEAGYSHGLWRSTDGGLTFEQLPLVEEGDNVGFGKAAPGYDYPAIYIVAQVEGVRGVFRSDDEGESWVRINDDAHRFGNMGEALTGDPRVYGRVYLGTNGRGILVADPVGAASSTSSIAMSSSSVASSVSSVSSTVSSQATSSSSLASSVSSVTESSISSSSSSSLSSFSSAVSSSTSSAANCESACNWYGSVHPVCKNQTSGWGWENEQTCIGVETCNDQWGDGGVVNGCASSSEAVSSAVSSATEQSSSSAVSETTSSASSASSSDTSTPSAACAYSVSSDWGTGYTGEITLTNTGDTTIQGWEVTWEYASETTITNYWNAQLSGDKQYTASDMGWNGTVAPGKSVSFGFHVTKAEGPVEIPTLTGSLCEN